MVSASIVYAKAKEVRKMDVDSLTKYDYFCQSQFDGFPDNTYGKKNV